MNDLIAPGNAPQRVRQTWRDRNPGLAPLSFPLVVAGVGFLAMSEQHEWINATISGGAAGMTYFVMAVGLSLVFGLMGAINFGHAALVGLGAVVGASALLASQFGVTSATSQSLLFFGAFVAVSTVFVGFAGVVFGRIFMRPAAGNPLRQTLLTIGGFVIAQQLIVVFWGPEDIRFVRPDMLNGSVTWRGQVLELYPLLTIVLGVLLFLLVRGFLRLSRAGLIVRAGSESHELLEAMGYRLSHVAPVVFFIGSALAGLGGVMWGVEAQLMSADVGSHVMMSVFIVVLIGGLGSVEGCFIAALLVGLTQSYTSIVNPSWVHLSGIALMVLVLIWRPRGLMTAEQAV